MNIQDRITQDIKTAMLAGDKVRLLTLRGIKSAILYVEVEQGKRDAGLDEDAVMSILGKESKKRQESAELYIKGGDQARADAELAEKAIIDEYLPKQLTDDEINALIDTVAAETGGITKETMGTVIGQVKQRAAGAADGAAVARLVKERL